MVCVILPKPESDYFDEEEDKDNDKVNFIQVWKPHRNAITKLSINPLGNILVSGSEDKTLFIHQLAMTQPFVVVHPIGFIELPAPATAISWKPNMVIVLFKIKLSITVNYFFFLVGIIEKYNFLIIH